MEMFYYSPDTGGFYTEAVHGEIPEHATIEVTPDEHEALFEAQASGATILFRNGFVTAEIIENAPTWDDIRRTRDRLLKESDWTQLRDISARVQGEWVAYRQALRDITVQASPDVVVWPVAPGASHE